VVLNRTAAEVARLSKGSRGARHRRHHRPIIGLNSRKVMVGLTCWLSPINAAEDLSMIKRRNFITGLGSAAAWPLATRAQQGERVRRIGVLLGWNRSSEARYLDAFIQELAHLGWVDGRNVRIEQRWTNADRDRTASLARELIELKPEVILAGPTLATIALRRESQSIPIVFTIVADPVGVGFVASLARPGGNLTGFTYFLEGEIAGKLINLLKEIAPSIRRVAIIFNPDTARSADFLGSFEPAARYQALEPVTVPVRTAAEIEAAILSLGRQQAGLLFGGDPFVDVHQGLIASLARNSKLPAIYANDEFAKAGGLISYGPSFPDIFRRAAGYVDRILKGEKPGDLPVQAPTKYELVLNLKTAKALGLTVPPNLLAIADEVIE
jgi:putative tryptophan/tyrosine transport system substrate-binding protein